MTRLQTLRQRAQELHAELEARMKDAKDDAGVPRSLTDEERTAQDSGLAELKGLTADILSAAELDSIPNQSTSTGDDQGTVTPDELLRGDDDDDLEIRVGTDRWLSRGFPIIGEQLQAVHAHYADEGSGTTDKRLLHLNATGGDPELRVASGLSETVPGDGGFMLQKDFQTEIRERAHEDGQILQRVTFTPIAATSTGLKFNVIKEDSRKDGSRGGGVRMYWTDEAAAFTKSAPKLRAVELSLSKLTGLYYTTNELLKDAPALGAKAVKGFGAELRFKSEDSFWRGDGSGKPLGIEGHAGTVVVDKESGQSAQTIIHENIVKMWARGRNRLNAVWMYNQDIEDELNLMTLAVGTGGTASFMPPGGVSQAPYGTLMGRPAIPVEYAQTLGTEGDLVLCDWDAYEAIDKGAPDSATSMHVRFLFDEDVFRIIYRIDGQPLHDSPLTPYKGTTTTAHFVALQTR